MAGVRDVVRRIRARLQGRADTEHVVSANRAFFCVSVTAYVEVRHILPNELALLFSAASIAITAMIFAHIVAYPAPNAARRTVALIADIAVLCTVMHFSDEEGAAFYPIILWIVFGNGFRFGLEALRMAVLAGCIGFTVVALTTPFWQAHASLAVGLGLGALILPAYAGVLIRSLTQARLRAEAANDVKSVFLANVSHELRTPLQALVGTTDLLKKTNLATDQVELVQITSTASQTLLLMINDFLKFTGLNVGDTAIECLPTGSVALLQDVAGLSSSDCKAKDLRLAMHVGLGTPMVVNADGRHIREVLLNLVGNALKFTAKGGILLAVESRQSHEGLFLRFSVADTGIGVPDAAKDKIFERFTQADKKIAQTYGGTGLGLAICKRLVERMGGRIGVENGRERGSVFWFEVPTASAESVQPAVSPALAPVLLLMPETGAKDRVASAVSKQRRVTHLVADHPGQLLQVLAAQEVGQIVVLQTAAAAARSKEVDAVLARRTRNDRRPIVLVDDAGAAPASAAWDPRWIATARIPARFTDEQVREALAIADRFAEAAPEDVTEQIGSAQAERSRILIVDDNRTNQLIYSKVLESTGHSCQVAVNGQDAINVLEESSFDLVLMDVNMPVVDGITATKMQRVAELGLSHTPIIGITADASPEMTKNCLAAGMDACLIKPVSSPALLGLVNEILGRAAQKADAADAARPIQQLGQVADVDWQPLDGLAKVGGEDFLREVMAEFMKDCWDLLGDLAAAMAVKQVGQVRAAAHAIASTSANVGATRVRGLALELERLPEELIHREGTRRAGQIRDAIKSYVTALGEVAGAGGGRQIDFD